MKTASHFKQDRIKCPYCGHNQECTAKDKTGEPALCVNCFEFFKVERNG